MAARTSPNWPGRSGRPEAVSVKFGRTAGQRHPLLLPGIS
jgi:hypothetical protein